MECINNCSNDDIYIYEFNNTCYNKCPNGTHISSNNKYLCELDLICDNYYNYNHTGCINEIPDGYFINDTIFKTIDKCHSDCKTCEGKEIENNSNCKTCKLDKYFDLGNCLSSCVNGYYTDIFNNKICKCSYNKKCLNCSNESIKYDLCITCNNNYYPKYNDSSNKNSFINCYNDLDGYYLDNNIYKPCYSSCKKCNILGDENNNKCIECNDNFIFINDYDMNCYEKCNYYYYFDSLKKYHCTINNECPNGYKLIKEKLECINNCSNDDIYIYEFNDACYKICPNGTHISSNNKYLCETNDLFNDISRPCDAENLFNGICGTNNKNSSVKDQTIINIQKEILNGNINILLNTNSINEGKKKDLLIKEKYISYQITTTDSLNNKEYDNISTIRLGKCEDELRKHYNISNETSLLILKIEIYIGGLYIPIIEYEVYDLDNKKKLNLNICKNEKINIIIPVSINEKNLFKHNSSNEYYNDKCYIYTSDKGTDIILKDRRNEYIQNNMSLCEKNCEYKGYNRTSKKVNCECEVKNTFTLFSNVIIDKDRLLKKFVDIKTSANIDALQCPKIVFSIDGLKNNIGSYIILSIILIYIISLFLFIFKGFNNINITINKIREHKNKKKIKKLKK